MDLWSRQVLGERLSGVEKAFSLLKERPLIKSLNLKNGTISAKTTTVFSTGLPKDKMDPNFMQMVVGKYV